MAQLEVPIVVNVTRRTVIGSGVAAMTGMLAAPYLVDQHMDPILIEGNVETAQVDPDAGELELRTGPYLLETARWRVIGPSGMPGEPKPISQENMCPSCGEIHHLGGYAIYTVGCHPAALPFGVAGRSGLALFEVTIDAHPAGVTIPNCPGVRYAPHVHSPQDYRWV